MEEFITKEPGEGDGQVFSPPLEAPALAEEAILPGSSGDELEETDAAAGDDSPLQADFDPVKIIAEFVQSLPADIDRRTLLLILNSSPLIVHLAQGSNLDIEIALDELKERLPILKPRDLKRLDKDIGEARNRICEAAPCGVCDFTANFSNLVDLAEHEGAVVYLVKEGDRLEILAKVQKGEQTLVPPPKESITWMLPGAREVQNIYAGAADSDLYDDCARIMRKIPNCPAKSIATCSAPGPCTPIH